MAEILSDDEMLQAISPDLYLHIEGANKAARLADARAVERAVISRLAAMGGELPEGIAYTDQRDLDKDGNWDTFIAKHASEWHEGLRFNAPLYTADQLRAERAKGVAAGMAQEQRWIPVGERMPPPGEEVLVYLAEPPFKGANRIVFDCWDEQHEAPVSWSSLTIPVGLGWDSGTDYEGITHWQPMPPSPDEEQTR